MNEYKYLDLLQRKLDPSQKAACCRTQNTIVAAGAGSGKTQVLATRFAWLVMSCNVPVGKILTLTFTKKAAAEMYNRIYETLTFFANHSEVGEKERALAQKALDNFSEAHIQTLDSYCNSILRQCANRYGIKPDFGQGEGDDIESKALAFVYKYRNEPEIKAVASLGGFQNFADAYLISPVSTYTSIANYKDFFTNRLPAQKEILAKTWNKNVTKIPDIAGTIKAYIQEIARPNTAITNLDSLTDSENVPEPFLIKDYNQIGTKDLNIEDLEKCQEWFAKIIENKVDARARERADLSAYTKELPEAYEPLYNSFIQIRDFELTTKLLQRIEEFSQEVNQQKRISGNLSFSDITQMALKILVEQKDIRTQEKNAYSKIMIDEFQDNNGKNRDLLFLLSEKNDIYTEIPQIQNQDTIKELLKDNLESEKLYFVGDEKQSIYKFRGADVSVFNELARDLRTEPIRMVNNYRSKNELLSSFNQIFGGFGSNSQDDTTYESVFNREAEAAFEATFSELAKAQQVDSQTHHEIQLHSLNSDNIKSHVCMYNAAFADMREDPILGDEDQMAYFVARKIRETYDRAVEENREVKYSSFAILDKSRTNRYYYTKWLNKFGIPFTLDQQSRIFEEAPINDVYNFLKLCVYPSDNLSFTAVLTSPFVNLSETAAEEIVASLSKEEKFSPFALPKQLEDSLLTLNLQEDLEKYKHAVEFYKTQRKNFLSQRLTNSITTLWENLSYHYETLVNHNVNLLAEQYDLIFELARKSDEDSKSLAWFVDQLDVIRENEALAFGTGEDTEIDVKNTEYPLEREDAVQIMTIHKSKGLQFKTVFILGCTGAVKPDSEGIYFYTDETGLSITPNDCRQNCIFTKYKESDYLRKIAEFKRVLYVAVTRAEDEFYIVGKWSKKGVSENNLMQNIILQYYPDAAKPDAELTGRIQFQENAPFDFCSIESKELAVLWTTRYGALHQPTKDELIEEVSSFYQNATIVSTEQLPNNRQTPSGLETEGTPIDADLPQLECLKGINKIIIKNGGKPEDENEAGEKQSEKTALENDSNLENQDFGFGDFGTLCHAFLEDFINQGMKAEYSAADFTGSSKLFKNLNDEDKGKIKECAVSLCKSFAESAIGKEVYNAIQESKLVKTEWAFRMYKDELLYTGSIDLIFQNADETYTIVDYKTDAKLNNEKYIDQQRCYKTAAANMLGISEDKISCKLFYLRYAKEENLE